MKLTKIIGVAVALATVSLASVPAHAQHKMNRYGGSAYLGNPALNVTASFVKAGGGTANFSMVK